MDKNIVNLNKRKNQNQLTEKEEKIKKELNYYVALRNNEGMAKIKENFENTLKFCYPDKSYIAQEDVAMLYKQQYVESKEVTFDQLLSSNEKYEFYEVHGRTLKNFRDHLEVLYKASFQHQMPNLYNKLIQDSKDNGYNEAENFKLFEVWEFYREYILKNDKLHIKDNYYKDIDYSSLNLSIDKDFLKLWISHQKYDRDNKETKQLIAEYSYKKNQPKKKKIKEKAEDPLHRFDLNDPIQEIKYYKEFSASDEQPINKYNKWLTSLEKNDKSLYQALIKKNESLEELFQSAKTPEEQNQLLHFLKEYTFEINQNKFEKEEGKYPEEETKSQDDNNKSHHPEIKRNFGGQIVKNKPNYNPKALKALVISCIVNADKTIKSTTKNELADEITKILTAQHKTSVHTLNAIKEFCLLKKLTTEKTNSLLENLESKFLFNHDNLGLEEALVKKIHDIIDVCLKFGFRYDDKSSYADLLDKIIGAEGLLDLRSEVESFIKREEKQLSNKAKTSLENLRDTMFNPDKPLKSQKEDKSTQPKKLIKKLIGYDKNPQNAKAQEYDAEGEEEKKVEENQPNSLENQIVENNEIDQASNFEGDDAFNPQDFEDIVGNNGLWDC